MQIIYQQMGHTPQKKAVLETYILGFRKEMGAMKKKVEALIEGDKPS
jgi:hypothetical protein